MAKKQKEKKPFHNRHPFHALVSKIASVFIFKKPQIINLAGEIADKSIILSNHSAKSGPAALDMYFPKKTAKWGAYQMFGNYESRKSYLRDILYIKKCGKKPGFGTSFKSSLMAVFSPSIYRGMWMMPTFPDARFSKTLRDSVTVLDANIPVMVFPENSNEGYKDILTEFFPGFVMLAEKYYRAKGEDVPVYPVYYCVRKRILIIDKPMFVQEMVKQGLDRYQIAERFCEAVNALYYEYVADKVTGEEQK